MDSNKKGLTEMKNEVVLDFILSDFDDIDHEEITGALNIKPIKVYRKGQRKSPTIPALAKTNR